MINSNPSTLLEERKVMICFDGFLEISAGEKSSDDIRAKMDENIRTASMYVRHD